LPEPSDTTSAHDPTVESVESVKLAHAAFNAQHAFIVTVEPF
jgi:hypothetical protein